MPDECVGLDGGGYNLTEESAMVLLIKAVKEQFPHGHPRFYEIMVELMKLHNDKNRDYATKEDPLQNFTRVARWCKEYKLVTEGFEPLKVAIIYALKQFDAALKLLMHGEEGQVEGFDKRMADNAVYSVIEMILYAEELRQKEAAVILPVRDADSMSFDLQKGTAMIVLTDGTVIELEGTIKQTPPENVTKDCGRYGL